MRHLWGRLLHDPLLHFVVLGALLFLIWSWRGGEDAGGGNADGDGRHIVIDAAEQKLLVAYFAAQWRRLPSAAEYAELIDRRVHDEVLMREAIALGLDQGDSVIRQRLAQKLEMTLEEIAVLEQPSEAQLAAFHADRAQTYVTAGRLSFTHRFVDAKRHGDDLSAAGQALLEALRSAQAHTGDPFHAPLVLRDVTADQLGRILGPTFAAELLQLAASASANGEWAGPLASPWGLHVVRIEAYQPAAPQPLEAVRDAVLVDWRRAAIEQAQARRIASMRAGYTVDVEPFDLLEFDPP